MVRACFAQSLEQLEEEPTREKYLLDLVLSDLGAVAINIHTRMPDHNMVLPELDSGAPECFHVAKIAFGCPKTNWDQTRHGSHLFRFEMHGLQGG